MASSSKKVALSAAESPKFQALELFPVSAINPGKWVQSKTFADSSVEFVEIMKKAGWNDALSFHYAWYHDPYAIFWSNAKVVGGTIVGEWEDSKIIISQDVIGKILGVKSEGLEYSKDWEKVLWQTVDTNLYGVRRPETNAGAFLRASRMKPLHRLFHNLLFHIVFAKRGGKDNVFRKDRVILYHLFLREKINLPSLILESWIDALKQRSFTKVVSAHSIPFPMIFAGVLRLMDAEKSLNLNRLALYAAGEEIVRATFNKMQIGKELFPLTKIKDEPVEESSEPAQASAPPAHAPSAPPAQTKPPHKARIKRPVSPSKRKPTLASIVIDPRASAQSSAHPSTQSSVQSQPQPKTSFKPPAPFVPINPKHQSPPPLHTQKAQTVPTKTQTKPPPPSTSAQPSHTKPPSVPTPPTTQAQT